MIDKELKEKLIQAGWEPPSSDIEASQIAARERDKQLDEIRDEIQALVAPHYLIERNGDYLTMKTAAIPDITAAIEIPLNMNSGIAITRKLKNHKGFSLRTFNGKLEIVLARK